jgi:uncharacterized protein YybS (DUF2232 family)
MTGRRSPAGGIHRLPAADPDRGSTRRPTRGLTEGAILAAVTAVVAAVGLIIPPIGILLAPLPVMLLVIRWGMRTAVLAAVVSGLILLQFFGPLAALSITGIFAPLGLALGWGARRGGSAQLIILAGSGALLLSMVATLALTIYVLHQDVLGQLIRTQVQGLQMALDLQQRLGVPPQQLEPMRALVDSACSEHHCFLPIFPQLIRTMLPGGLILGSLVWAYLCYLSARSVLRRVGHEIPAVPPVLTWRISAPLALGLLLTYAALVVASLWLAEINVAGANAYYATLFVFGFQGLLVGLTWMNRRQVPRFTQIVAVLLFLNLSMQIPLLLAILMYIGILDTWFDYRRLSQHRPTVGTNANGEGETKMPEGEAGPERVARAKAVHPS